MVYLHLHHTGQRWITFSLLPFFFFSLQTKENIYLLCPLAQAKCKALFLQFSLWWSSTDAGATLPEASTTHGSAILGEHAGVSSFAPFSPHDCWCFCTHLTWPHFAGNSLVEEECSLGSICTEAAFLKLFRSADSHSSWQQPGFPQQGRVKTTGCMDMGVTMSSLLLPSPRGKAHIPCSQWLQLPLLSSPCRMTC